MKNLLLTGITSDKYPGEIEKQIHFTGQADENHKRATNSNRDTSAIQVRHIIPFGDTVCLFLCEA
jgi:hypothetical protein